MSMDVQAETSAPVRRVVAATATSPPAPRRLARAGSWRRRGAFAVGTIAAVAVVASLMLGSIAPRKPTSPLTHTISRGELLVTVTEQGTLESAKNKDLKCQVKGGSTILWIIADGTQVEPGDELVRLDASKIEDEINQQQITYQTALASRIQAESDLAVAEINVTEYLEGTFRKELQTAQSNVALAEENLRVARNILEYSEKMFRQGYVGKLELDTNHYAVEHAELELALKKTEVDVLERFTKPKKLQELQSAHSAAKAKLASAEAALHLEQEKLKRLEAQRDACVMRAEASGIVIYAKTEIWREEPAIEEGSTVREQQTLLQMPDLDHMQVSVGVHESKVRQLAPGMPARIEIQDSDHTGQVVSVATQASPSGWWDGNTRNFETIVKLNDQPDVRPGMSAEVEITIARHQDVLTVPVAAVVEQQRKFHSWVDTGMGLEKRTLELGDSNDQFIVVKGGLSEGDRVVLNPRDYVDEVQRDALRPVKAAEAQQVSG
jgi:multidrug efflux pump subunit AcrA (membrane-fusion protein)